MPFLLLRAPRLVDLRHVVLHRGDHHRGGGYARDDTPHAIAMRVRGVNQAPKRSPKSVSSLIKWEKSAGEKKNVGNGKTAGL
jgi:hypothetical protein